ncbi:MULTISPECIES: GbsR/MarR family transcriptional regulator [Duganella]|jgi:DNA-binding transcriptional regulator GbsR (MarR family)|uniref:GbsR/MarR family transcriptional regulator n=1 Tax=Duganella TaxID=75654 RepID=UPI00159D0709
MSTSPPLPPLTPLAQKFILHFGEMGSRWGINRTVGQIYALLYVSARPLNADEIAESLSFSRSNVSMGLKELQSWRLVKLLHQPNDRREYFEPPKDIWDIFKALLEERRRREVEPTLSMLRDALLETPSTEADRVAQERMREMYNLIELSSSWFDDVQRLSPETLASLMKMGSTVKKLLDVGETVRDTFRFGRSVEDAAPDKDKK